MPVCLKNLRQNSDLLLDIAKEFVSLNWATKFSIGVDLGLLNDEDCCINEEELEETVFVGTVEAGRIEQLIQLMNKVNL
jgi:hypothetical protein